MGEGVNLKDKYTEKCDKKNCIFSTIFIFYVCLLYIPILFWKAPNLLISIKKNLLNVSTSSIQSAKSSILWSWFTSHLNTASRLLLNGCNLISTTSYYCKNAFIICDKRKMSNLPSPTTLSGISIVSTKTCSFIFMADDCPSFDRFAGTTKNCVIK